MRVKLTIEITQDMYDRIYNLRKIRIINISEICRKAIERELNK